MMKSTSPRSNVHQVVKCHKVLDHIMIKWSQVVMIGHTTVLRGMWARRVAAGEARAEGEQSILS